MRQRIIGLGDKNIIGAKIVKIRKEQEITQAELLKRFQLKGVNISHASLSKLEGQQRHAQDYEVVLIAKCLEVPVTDLFDEQLFKDWVKRCAAKSEKASKEGKGGKKSKEGKAGKAGKKSKMDKENKKGSKLS